MPSSPTRRRWPKLVGATAALASLGAVAFGAHVWPALGARPSGERLDRIKQSPQWNGSRFANVLPTIKSGMSAGSIWNYVTGGSDYRTPDAPLPVQPRTAADFAQQPDDLRITWLGHSTFLLELDGTRLLVDPVWGDHASPSPLLGVGRFYAPPLALDDLPPVDAVVISHDHYDHLDAPTIQALADRIPRFVVPLGVGSHLEAWGVAPDRISELDWWDTLDVGDITLTSTPARHFSGRALVDRDATLWSGWAFVGSERRVFYSGDTALSPVFHEIGERLGPFDVTLIECGAYADAWADLHLGPEQAVAVHRMVKGEVLIPVHWGLFDLALHGWTEPIERIRAATDAAGIRAAFPHPGQSITLADVPSDAWWPSLPWQTGEEAPVYSSAIADSIRVLIP